MQLLSKVRIDRLLTLGLVRPLSQPLRRERQVRVPILMYHSISDDLGNSHPYFETNTSQALFTQQMQFLHERGYSTLDLGEAGEITWEGKQGDKVVVITFDDGYQDFYTHACPVLIGYGFKATAFVVTDFTSSQKSSANGKQYMSWNQVCEVHALGMQIGSHTVTHPELQWMSTDKLEYEIRASKEVIEDRIGVSITSFAYPYAFPEGNHDFVTVLEESLARSGYENGVSTIIGTACGSSNHFCLPRLPINSYDDRSLFQAKLEGAYDWMHLCQYVSKILNPMFA